MAIQWETSGYDSSMNQIVRDVWLPHYSPSILLQKNLMVPISQEDTYDYPKPRNPQSNEVNKNT